MKIQYESDSYQAPRAGLILLQCAVALLFFLFVVRFWYLQIHTGQEFARLAQENRLRSERIYSSRGLIRSADGTLLAENRPAFGLALVREDCQDIPATLAHVSQWTGIPLERLTAKMEQDLLKVKPFEPLLLIPDLSFEQLARIESSIMFWPGLEIITRSKRNYPQGPLFCHILGYVAEANEKEMEQDKGISLGDNVGKLGLEFMLEKRLRGSKGLYQLEVDVLGRALNKKMEYPPQSGDNIQLSIDSSVQQAAWNALEGQAGCVVVLNPDNAQVVALVTSPAYDNNAFGVGLSAKDWAALRDDPRFPLQNRAIQSVYPPGSVWKLMMTGLFLKEGISPREGVLCRGEVTLGKQIFRCWKRGGHGTVDMKAAIVQSCDVYYYLMGERIGIDKIEDFARTCGFGSPTGIELPHEKGGLVPSRAWKRRRFNQAWHRGETYNISIGQGFTLVTPVQVASFVGALLNGGKLYSPTLLTEGNPTLRTQIPIPEQNRKLIVDSMRECVDAPTGTAKVLRRPDAIMGGKTGTAQVVKLKMIGEKRVKAADMEYAQRDHAWIATWGEKNGQRYVVVVMVEHGGGGSSVAGPIAKKIYEKLFGVIAQ